MKLYPLPNVRAEIIRPGMPLKSWIGKQEIKPFALINASASTNPLGTSSNTVDAHVCCVM